MHGRTISAGMAYVGRKIAGLSAKRAIEPALIEPKLKIATTTVAPASYYYWDTPAYNKITPSDRANYLDWLAAGRPEGATPQQFRLFLYGIERRILFDARYDQQARDEIPVLLEEVDRLTRSYQGYDAMNIRIAAANLQIAGRARIPGFDPTSSEPPRYNEGWSMPLALKLALGTFAAEQRPLPAKWAFSWAICSPYTYLSTVERRCPTEFASLFHAEYHRHFGQGIMLSSSNYGNPVTYKPMSPSFQRALPVGPRGLLQIGSAHYGQSTLIDLVRGVSASLEEFARWAGMDPERAPLFAYAFLPEGLGPLERHPRVAPFVKVLDAALGKQSSVVVRKAEFLTAFPELIAGATPRQALALSRLLERIGYGIEPDPTAMKTPFLRSEVAGLYRIEYGPNPYYADRDISEQLAVLSLWSYVAASEGPIAQQTGATVVAMLEQRYEMEPFEINRIRAHAGWLTHHPATLNDARRRFGLSSCRDVEETGRLLAALAVVDAAMTPVKIKALAKIYTILGLSDEQLHADIHRVSTGSNGAVQILRGGSVPGFGIPAESHEVSLDPVQIDSVRRQTTAVSSLLHDVFGDVPEHAGETEATERAVIGTRNPFFQLADQLSAQPFWSMVDVKPLAASLGLMATGAIETINNHAVMLGLTPPIECDDDVCDIDQSILKELLNHV